MLPSRPDDWHAEGERKALSGALGVSTVEFDVVKAQTTDVFGVVGLSAEFAAILEIGDFGLPFRSLGAGGGEGRYGYHR